MSRKSLWITAIVFIVFVVSLQAIFHPASGPDNMPRAFWIFLDAVGSLITFLIAAAVPAFLLALIPYKGWSFKEKWKALLPITSLVIAVILGFVFGYSEYLAQVKGIKLNPVR